MTTRSLARRATLLVALANLAWMLACGGGSGSNSNVAPPPPTITSVTVTCSPTSLAAGQSSQCTASVTGTGSYSSSVVWSASAGTINATGLFSSTGVNLGTKVTITATSSQDISKTGTATVSLDTAVTAIAVSCTPQQVHPGDTSQCNASVSGTGNFSSAVTWSGVIDATQSDCKCVSSTGLVTAPRVDGSSTISISAKSVETPAVVGTYQLSDTLSGTVTSVTVSCLKTTLYPGQDSLCSAQVTGTGDYSSAVTWDSWYSGYMVSAEPGLYLPGPIIFPDIATIRATSVQNGLTGQIKLTLTPYAVPPNNVTPAVVDPGPVSRYVNGAFASVTVCAPGTYNCQTIDHLLVDTGSSGVRLLATAAGGQFNLPLPQEKVNQGNNTTAPLVECAQFVSGYLWGPVMRADIQTLPDGSGEWAPYTLIQVVGQPGEPAVPAACSSSGPDMSTLQALGANGILGVGLFQEDCGTTCYGSNQANIYFACPAGVCSGTPVLNQVGNPVVHFGADNTGVVLQLPSVTPPGAQTLSGSLIWGINTQPNNQLGNAQVFTVDTSFGTLSVKYGGTSYPISFFDSGSNGMFFLNSTTLGAAMPSCNGWYCPTSTQTFTATNTGTNSNTADVTFSIDNATQLFATDNTALPTLGGSFDLGGGFLGFDYGLPFFYGRRMYIAPWGAVFSGPIYGPFVAY